MEILQVPADCEITTVRTVNAPQLHVFHAWTKPELLKNWWGPKGFTNTFHTFDPTPGGQWNFIMHGPDGTNYVNESQFVAIHEPDFLVFNHLSNPKFQVEASFERLSETETRVTFRMKFESKQLCDQVKAYAVGKNEENMDRLEAVLRQLT